ncbi:nuclear transport factor 2 family protein [uncultured Pontibacter sp.]|uniref:YybH family protein n=1 Tax=uncultured Pontibacter sp. TaxID=453356 RepID=UPI002624ACEE|nr:nuclear transport factor 2 family protein [uncultured Pontibacter sp.]
MRTKHFAAILLLTGILAASCTTHTDKTVKNERIAMTDAISEVKQALDGQVAAWNKGELENAMDFYWESPDMLWISRNGTEKGWQEVLEMFQTDFTDRSKMGEYTYEPLHIEQVGPEAVYYVYRWKIDLQGKKLMGGVSSQLWKKVEGRWVITSEHAS